MDKAPLPLFYRSVTPLDRQAHARLKYKAPDNLSFTADASLIPLLTAEFGPMAREYPIVFMRESETSEVIPVALTGMPQGKNLFLTDAGRWDARYVPAYVRRYPFVFVETAPDNFAVCVDTTATYFNEKEGVPLFGEDGEPSSALKDTVKALTDYQQAMHFTRTFMSRLAAANILTEGNAKADFTDGRSLTWRGFWVVDEKRFRELPEATLKDWFATGELGLIYAHLLSLGNLTDLMRRYTERAAGAAKAS